jgi:type IV secretory pathway VirB2 component (pilin)
MPFRFALPAIFVLAALLAPDLALASVESTLTAMQTKLISTILPLAAILGLVFAGLSFVMGSPNARSHLVLAIIGAVVGFGAPSLITFIRGLVQ